MFIARQPIFNKSMGVYGYELLHRSSSTATAFEAMAPGQATARVFGGFFEFGAKSITDAKKAFINFDYDFLLSDAVELLNPDSLIIEILEDMDIDREVLERLIQLKKQGYKIALDDFVEKYEEYPIIPMSDIIKFDILETPLSSIQKEVGLALSEGKTILAEKVESKEEYEKAKDMGFTLFQGYFFKKPSIVSQSCNGKSVKLSQINILNELAKEEPSFDNLAKIVQSDVSLAYRLFRIIKNNDLASQLDSIKEALIIMGLRGVQRWINILILQDLTVDKPLELMRLSLIRSKFGELICEKSKLDPLSNQVSTMLLFSTLDALLDKPIEDALRDIPIAKEIKDALIEGKGQLTLFLQLVYSYETGDWEMVDRIATKIHLQSEDIYHSYLDAIEYCKTTMKRY